MTDKEKIIAEIERLKSCKLNLEEDTEYLRGYDFAIDTIEEFINSLSAEQQNDDLDGEIKLYQLRNPVINHNERSLNELIKRVATYFANWQKEQLMKSAIDGCYISRNKYTKKNVLNAFDIKCDTIQKFRDGDKVKIIIIKENEK